MLDDSDDDCSTGKPPAKKDKKSAFEERKDAVQKMADKLHSKHGSTLIWCSTNYGLKHCTASNTPAGMSHQKDCHGVTAKRINLLSLREEEQLPM